jgi:hypothetical protein
MDVSPRSGVAAALTSREDIGSTQPLMESLADPRQAPRRPIRRLAALGRPPQSTRTSAPATGTDISGFFMACLSAHRANGALTCGLLPRLDSNQ